MQSAPPVRRRERPFQAKCADHAPAGEAPSSPSGCNRDEEVGGAVSKATGW